MRMELTDEQIAAWVARHLASAPERDEAWAEAVRREYLAGREEYTEVPAA